jgi:hypothetical protein
MEMHNENCKVEMDNDNYEVEIITCGNAQWKLHNVN